MRKSNIELYQKNRELTLKLYKVQCELRKIKDNSDQVVTLQREISLLHSKVCAIIDVVKCTRELIQLVHVAIGQQNQSYQILCGLNQVQCG